MYEKIVVAVDNSLTAKLALQEAVKLAQFHKAKLIIIHIADITLPQDADIGYIALDIGKYVESIKNNSMLLLNNMSSVAKSAGVDTEIQLIETQQYGDISARINEAVKDLHANLLVIGTQGRKGLSRFFLGSVAEGVIRSAMVPVLLIHGQKETA